MRWIERLRSKSRETKSQAALVVAIGVTVLIAVVWVTTLPARFSGISSISIPKQVQPAALKEAVSAFVEKPAPTPTKEEQLRAEVEGLIDNVTDEKTDATIQDQKKSQPMRIIIATSSASTTRSASTTKATTSSGSY